MFRPTWAMLAVALVSLLTGFLVAACGSPEPRPDPSRRTWRGPTETVSSQGVTSYERREIAQKVYFPLCITVGSAAFRFDAVEEEPPGLLDTGYSLDRWRLSSFAGAIDEQPRLFIIVRGSTGIAAVYPRLPAGSGC